MEWWYFDDEKENKREIILNSHDSIILSGIETQYNYIIKTARKIKNRAGFEVKFECEDCWKLVTLLFIFWNWIS